MKPPFIAAMGFQKLTLGELPLELEGLRVVGGGGHEGARLGARAPAGGRETGGCMLCAAPRPRILLSAACLQPLSLPASLLAISNACARAAYAGAAAREEGAPGGARAHVAAASAAAADMLELEVDFAWVGEPNISFFVEMALAG